MLNALSQSPITAQQFYEWNEKLIKDEIMVREIIDIDTNYMEEDNTSQKLKIIPKMKIMLAIKTMSKQKIKIIQMMTRMNLTLL